jgi:hypothetical protein
VPLAPKPEPDSRGLVPAIHAFSGGTKDVDARDKPAHDDKKVQMELRR